LIKEEDKVVATGAIGSYARIDVICGNNLQKG